MNELFPTTQKKHNVAAPFSTKLRSERAQVSIMQGVSMLSITETNRGLMNCFTMKEANPAQLNDLLNFRSIDQREYLQRIASVILKNPSVHAPNRRRRLQTFSAKRLQNRE